MKFRYAAMTAQGQQKQGVLSAEDQQAAITRLQQKGLFVHEISALGAAESGPAGEGGWQQLGALLPVKTAQKVFFFRQLALMFRSGLSVNEALGLLAGIQGGRMRLVIQDMNQQIATGKSFSVALAQHESIFSPFALHMLRSAEASGELEAALVRIADFMQRRAEVRAQVLSSMTYPVVVLLMTVGVFIFLMSTVIPKFAGFFEKTGRVPPPEMLQMMSISNAISSYGWFWLLMLLVAVIVMALAYARPTIRLVVDRGLLRMPLLGRMLSAGAMSQLTWGLSSMLQSGLSVVQALKIISGMVSNRAIAYDLEQAADDILRGSDLSKSLRKPTIERLIQEMTQVGERTGSMVAVMRDAGMFYEERVKSLTKALAGAMEPLSILLVGGIVGYVYYGFFKSMFAVSG